MCRQARANAVAPYLFLVVVTVSIAWPIGPMWAFDITVDGDGSEWNPDGAVMDAPGLPNVGHIARNGTNQGQFIWTDEGGDERTSFGDPDERVDLTEFRVTSNATTFCMLAVFTAIGSGEATDDGAPMLQVGVDTDRATNSGEESFAGLPYTRVSANANWEYLITTRFGTGVDAAAAPSVTPDPDGGDWTFPQVGSATISETNELIEMCVAWSDLGFVGPPTSPLRLTVGVFRQADSGDVWDVSGTANLLDAITNYGVPGTETGAPGLAGTNTWVEVETEDRVDYYVDVYFNSETGEVQAPLLISEVAMRSGDADFIELYNPNSFAIDLAGFVTGDEQLPTASDEGMVVFPSFSLDADEFVVFAADAEAFFTSFAGDADFTITPGTRGVPTVTDYEDSWGGTALSLDDTLDEVLLLDPSETVIDVAMWGRATTTWDGHQDTNVDVASASSLQRTVLTEDTHQIDGGLGGDFFTTVAAPTPGETVECTEDDECLDGDFCNGAETCDGTFACVSGTPPVDTTPADDYACTVTTCTNGGTANEGTVTHVPSDALCLDGLFCNGTESCVPGEGTEPTGCIVSPVPDLDDGFGCTLDSCSEGADITDNVGLVSHSRRDWWCLDDLFCNGEEDCNPAHDAAGTDGCVAGSPPTTDDSVDCTVDSCDEATDSITHQADNTLCSDDDDCTNDMCDVSEDCQFSLLGCTIDAVCVFQGAANPSNACQVCNVAMSDSAWTQLNVGVTCVYPTCDDDGNAVGMATCSVDGLCVAPEPEVCGDGGCRDGDCLDLCGADDDCADGLWCELETGECTDENRPPQADAGVAQVVDEFGLVTLDGRGSIDPDGDTVGYAWSQTEGLEVELSTPTAATTTFDAPRVQEGSFDLVFELVVSDDETDSEPAETTVTVENTTGNTAPIASIQGETEVSSGGAVILDGSASSDPDTDVLTFLWSQESGPQAVLGTTTLSTLAVNVPELEESADLSFGLIVNDGLLNSELTTFTVSVTVDTPQADTTDMGADVQSDAPTSGDVAATTEPDEEGCGCSQLRPKTVAPFALILSVFLGLVVVSWRRTRSSEG